MKEDVGIVITNNYNIAVKDVIYHIRGHKTRSYIPYIGPIAYYIQYVV